MVRSIFSLAEWNIPFSGEFAPDVILYVVAPHMLFLKDDKHYLYDMLKKYGEKVLIALNIWYTDGVKVTTQANIEDAKKEIDQIYQTLYRDGSIVPRFVEVNARTGSGIPELTEQICRMLPQKKLGKVQKVLRDDLKTFAERERDRRFLSTLNRIAARLALYPVDQKVGQDDLIYLAAQGIAHYANTTFKGPDEFINIDHVVDQVKDIQRQQSESITHKEVHTKEKPLYERVPVLKEFTTTKQVKQQIEETVYENRAKRGRSHLEARLKNFGQRLGAFFSGASADEWKQIEKETQDRLVYKVAKKQTREIEVPVTEVEQKVVGYENQIVDTIEVVDRVVEVEVGRRALAGSFPVIAFLLGLGLGVRAFCLQGPARASLPTQIERQQQQVQLALGSEKHHLDRLIRDGAHAEKAMIALLDTRVTIHDAQS